MYDCTYALTYVTTYVMIESMAKKEMTAAQVRTRWRTCLDGVEAGDVVVIYRRGLPVAYLGPYEGATSAGTAGGVVITGRTVVPESAAPLNRPRPPMPHIPGMVTADKLYERQIPPIGEDPVLDPIMEPFTEVVESRFCVNCGEPGREVKSLGQLQVLCFNCKPEAR